ncbi:MAG: alpha-hydroxy-acid oxidizing protein [Comamonadaceae bacterium]|nr:alpha-hydroxy-acid oxidizing protein [Comamonadaceae bacterium]
MFFFGYLLEKNGIDPETDVVLDYSFPTHIDLANAVAGIVRHGGAIRTVCHFGSGYELDVRTLFDLNLEWDKLQWLQWLKPLLTGSFCAGTLKRLSRYYLPTKDLPSG